MAEESNSSATSASLSSSSASALTGEMKKSDNKKKSKKEKEKVEEKEGEKKVEEEQEEGETDTFSDEDDDSEEDEDEDKGGSKDAGIVPDAHTKAATERLLKELKVEYSHAPPLLSSFFLHFPFYRLRCRQTERDIFVFVFVVVRRSCDSPTWQRTATRWRL
jgi:hypothetical protein